MKYQSNARENQDLFTLAVLDKKVGGTYVEIGAYKSREDNNTYLLEQEFDWKGVSLELYPQFASTFKGRKNPCITCNALEVDYDQLFQEHFQDTHIDFLQIDIDPTSANYKILELIDFKKYSFSIITFEHNLYLTGDKSYYDGEDCEMYMNMSRDFLKKRGYTLLVPNVTHDDKIFEDWFILENKMPSDTWKKFIDVDPVWNPRNIKSETVELLNSLL